MKRFPRISLAKTGERITCLMKASGLSVKDLQDALGFQNPQAIYKWRRGECLPSIDNLVILATLFKVTVDKIVVLES